MCSLPESWVAIDRDAGSASRGLVHHGLVAGVDIVADQALRPPGGDFAPEPFPVIHASPPSLRRA